jgi:hypothetical protein
MLLLLFTTNSTVEEGKIIISFEEETSRTSSAVRTRTFRFERNN